MGPMSLSIVERFPLHGGVTFFPYCTLGRKCVPVVQRCPLDRGVLYVNRGPTVITMKELPHTNTTGSIELHNILVAIFDFLKSSI